MYICIRTPFYVHLSTYSTKFIQEQHCTNIFSILCSWNQKHGKNCTSPTCKLLHRVHGFIRIHINLYIVQVRFLNFTFHRFFLFSKDGLILFNDCRVDHSKWKRFRFYLLYFCFFVSICGHLQRTTVVKSCMLCFYIVLACVLKNPDWPQQNYFRITTEVNS